MSTNEINTRWQDLAVFSLRWVFLIAISAAIYLWRAQPAVPDTDYTDLYIAAGVGAFLNIVFIVSAYIRQIEPGKPYIFILMDAALAGMFTYVALRADFTQFVAVSPEPDFLPLIAGYLTVTGFMYLGPVLGLANATGVLAVCAGLFIYLLGLDQLELLIDPFTIPLITAAAFVIGAGVWAYAKTSFGDEANVQLNRLVQTRAQQIQAMEERARTISEMTTTLTSTLKFEKILETALDIGRLSVRSLKKNKHTIGIVMLFRYDDMLYIADSRGLLGTDETKVIPGEQGIIGDTLRECVPIIGKDAWKDPELSQLGGFSSIKSMICIPLRAHYDNFGVLFFGSEDRDAFNPEQIDTLNSVGVQATVALQNAVLYSSLLEEKERLIQMEEDARKALVRDLHDIPTQTVSAVAMRIRIIMRLMERNPEQVMDELKTVEEMTLRATEEIRHVLFKLRPLALEDQGLNAALKQLADKMQKTYKQNMTIKVGPDVEGYLDDTQQGALFYLIEEACNNARKYAEAEMVNVQVARQGDVLYVRIADNGVGFDMEEAAKNERGSFGMINMRERAELLDGTLSIKSVPGRGTTIVVKIPLDLQSKKDESYLRDQIPTTKLAASVRQRIR